MAERMSSSPRFVSWFPLRVVRRDSLRDSGEKYKIYPATRERYIKSPLNQMRRRLNDLNRANIVL